MQGSCKLYQDKTWYHPGAQVEGTVYLDIAETDLKASSLILKFKGEEKTTLVCEDPEKKKIRESIETQYDKTGQPVDPKIKVLTRHDKMEYLNHIYYQATFAKNRVEIGQYEYPFTFKIPTDLPNSFQGEKSLTAKDKNVGHIKYKIQAIVDTKCNNFKDKLIMTVVQEEKNQNVLEESMIKPENKCTAKMNFSRCCGSPGVLQLNSRLNKPQYMPGREMVVNFDVVNSLGIYNVDKILITLYQKVRIASNSYNLNDSSKKDEKNEKNTAPNLLVYKDEIFKKELPGFPKNKDFYGETCEICLPPYLQSVTNGNQVQNDYHVTVTAFIGKKELSNNQMAEICHFPILDSQPFDPPILWDPKYVRVFDKFYVHFKKEFFSDTVELSDDMRNEVLSSKTVHIKLKNNHETDNKKSAFQKLS